MKRYEISLYDPQARTSKVVAVLTERRHDPARPTGRYTIYKWLEAIFGAEWLKANRPYIGIVTRTSREITPTAERTIQL